MKHIHKRVVAYCDSDMFNSTSSDLTLFDNDQIIMKKLLFFHPPKISEN